MRLIAIAGAAVLISHSAFAMSGSQVAKIMAMCSEFTYEKCPADNTSHYCYGYRPAALKMCLLKNDVPPEYIAVLTQ